MAMSTWFVLGVICLLYVAFGIWAVSQIFPRTPAARSRSTSEPVDALTRPSANLYQKASKILLCPADRGGMTRADTTPATGRQDPDRDGPPTHEAGIPVITVVEAEACHLCDDAKSALAALAQSYPMTVHLLSIGDEPGRALMDRHRAPMSPLVLLDGEYFSSGRLPRRKLERRLSKALLGETNG